MNKECHRCQFNGKHSECCLSCVMPEQYDYRYAHYIKDGFEPQCKKQEPTPEMTTID